jgi:hypothetical protein
MATQTKERGGSADIVEVEAGEKAEVVPDLIRIAANGTLTDAVEIDATDWFMDDNAVPEAPPEKELRVNVGIDPKKVWVKWVIRSVPPEDVQRYRREATDRRELKSGSLNPEVNNMQVALKIVLHGTAYPRLHEIAEKRGANQINGRPIPDPDYGAMQVLRHQFKYQEAKLSTLSDHILGFSGWDTDDVKDAVAAGKS